ncbi:MAG TPA: hypothetical protein VF605_13595 [Allosphingosinicella sp.]|jgi:hypothetical protein
MGSVLGAVAGGRIGGAFEAGRRGQAAWTLAWAALLWAAGGLSVIYYSPVIYHWGASPLIFLAGGIVAGVVLNRMIEGRGWAAFASARGRLG